LAETAGTKVKPAARQTGKMTALETLFIMLYKTALGLIFFDFMGQLPKNYGIFPQSGNSEADQ